MPTPTIPDGRLFFDATTYAGNGSAGTDLQTIVNTAGFKPDLVWVKARNQAYSHHLSDSVRGIDKSLFSNSTSAESTYTYNIHAFNSNGFSIGNAASQNESGSTYVGWQWQAGQGTTSSNTAGSITSTVSVNPTAGFSVVTYTGNGSNNSTFGHGLGVSPSMVIAKARSNGTDNWQVWHTKLTSIQYYMQLNTTGAQANDSSRWGTNNPTSSVMNLGYAGGTNANGTTYVAYCWSEIEGFSKFGSYTGNGSTDGPFVYTGFRPKFVMLKNATTGATNWQINDSARDTYNVMDKRLAPSTSDAEATGFNFGDFTSNGFKIRQTDQTWNKNGDTYIYMAFAENPFKYANAR